MTARFALALLVALAGCGGDDGSSSGEPPAPIEGEDEIKAAWCEALVSCQVYPDVETCMAAIDVVGPEMRAAFEAGNASFDSTAAADCEAALGDVTCEELGGVAPDLEACGDVWDGTQGDGDECTTAAECASDWCDPGDCDPALSCCTGVCAAVEVDDGADRRRLLDRLVRDGSLLRLEAVPATCREPEG